MDYKNDIDKMISFFNRNNTKSLKFREDKLLRLKNAILSRRKDIENALYKDLGKSTFEANFSEISIVLEELEYAIKNIRKWMKPKRIKSSIMQFPSRTFEYSDPLGVSLIICPWNYPFQLAINPLIGAISAGNCVALKLSEFSPNTSEVIKEITDSIFEKAFVKSYTGDKDVATALLENKFDHIFFTGSTDVGRIIMMKGAETLTPVTLELGGKSPCIIDETANLKIAAERILFGKIINAGQTCVAPDYCLVDEKVKDKFIEQLKKEVVKQLPNSDYIKNNYTKIVNERHFERLNALLENQKIIRSGVEESFREFKKEDRFMPVTIVDEPDTESDLMKEEIFGPILPVLSYKDVNDAIAFIKSRPRPLSLYTFTEELRISEGVIKEVSFGGGCINDTLMQLTSPNAPFGGVGSSGTGYYHGKHTFDTFSHKKVVLKSFSIFDMKMKYHPYSDKAKKFISKFMK